MSLDKYLIEHCSPTLASIKTANMFSCAYESEENLKNTISLWNGLFKDKGIELILLKSVNNFALIYVCRKKSLALDLKKDGVADFLKSYGYESTDTDYAIERLKQRLKDSSSFPHEIGIFLDYPLDDVKGFIENSGANCICAGCWKVYCNECEAVKRFDMYNKCRRVYSRLFNSGEKNVLELTVNA